MIKIKLPWPDKLLSPNARCHWAVKSKCTKQHRALACIAARQQCGSRPNWKSAFYSLTCTLAPKQRQPDEQNLIAHLKAYVDGIEDAGIIQNDRGLRIGGPVDFIRGEKSEIEFVIWEAT
jgi:crossover junction endodeoxyribonuclease RusA